MGTSITLCSPTQEGLEGQYYTTCTYIHPYLLCTASQMLLAVVEIQCCSLMDAMYIYGPHRVEQGGLLPTNIFPQHGQARQVAYRDSFTDERLCQRLQEACWWLAGWLAAQQLRHTCEQAVSCCLKDLLTNQHHGIGRKAPQPQGTLAALASEASMPAC